MAGHVACSRQLCTGSWRKQNGSVSPAGVHEGRAGTGVRGHRLGAEAEAAPAPSSSLLSGHGQLNLALEQAQLPVMDSPWPHSSFRADTCCSAATAASMHLPRTALLPAITVDPGKVISPACSLLPSLHLCCYLQKLVEIKDCVGRREKPGASHHVVVPLFVIHFSLSLLIYFFKDVFVYLKDGDTRRGRDG